MENTANLRVIDMNQVEKEMAALRILIESETDLNKKLDLLHKESGMIALVKSSIGIMQPEIDLVRI